MHLRRLNCCLLAVLFMVCTSSFASTKLKVAYGDYPPYYGKGLDSKGPIAELVVEAFQFSNIEVEFHHLSWQDSLGKLKTGELDALFSAWKRKDRESWLAYSEAIAVDHLVLLNRKSNRKQFNNLSNIIQQRFGVVSGYQLPAQIGKNANIVARYKTEKENLKALSNGNIDTLLIDKRVAQHLICHDLTTENSVIEWFDTFTFKETQHLVVSKKVPNYQTLINAFNQGLQHLKNTGKLQAIISKHLANRDCPQFIPYTNPKDKNVIIAVGDWPPYFNEEEAQQGLLAAKIRKAFSHADIQVQFIFMPWQRAYNLAKNGLVDGTAVWLKTDERANAFNFSSPVLKEHHVFFYNKENPLVWSTLNDLADEIVVGLEGFSYGSTLDRLLTSGVLSMYRVRNDEQALKLLVSGKATVYPQEVNVGLAQIEKLLTPTNAEKINYHPTPFLQANSYLLIGKHINDSEVLIKAFNEGLLANAK